MTRSALNASLLLYLPNEILASILLEIPTLETLWNLLTAYPSLESLFLAAYKRILGVVIRRAGSLQLQKLICTVLAVHHRSGLGSFEEQDEYLHRLLTDRSKTFLLDDITDPTLALHDIVFVSMDIEYFERSFVASRLRCPGKGFKAAPEELPPTRTELHRIRHGFWRLQLSRSTSFGLAGFKIRGVLLRFIERLTLWEIEEVECIYYNLREQYGLLKDFSHAAAEAHSGSTISSQALIVQRLLINMGHEIGDRIPVSLDLNYPGNEKENHVSKAFDWARRYLWARRYPITVWSDEPLANSANEGWRCYSWNSARGVLCPSNYLPRGPVLCFLNWGYCMWDEERLIGWDLLGSGNESDPLAGLRSYSDIDAIRWADGNSGHGICAHCEAK